MIRKITMLKGYHEMKKTKLAKAVAMALVATAMSAATNFEASASTTMHNTFNEGTSPGNGTTDG